ncbi:MAG TPA: hypothetical protein VF452_10690, partial [Candidatus Binatia bacterium]
SRSKPIFVSVRLKSLELSLCSWRRLCPMCSFGVLPLVPLDLFHQGGPDALDQPNTVRGHRQKALGRIDARFDQYGCCSIGEPALCKS